MRTARDYGFHFKLKCNVMFEMVLCLLLKLGKHQGQMEHVANILI